MHIQQNEFRITGRVQMVMFRDFVQRKARKLGLVGFVKNMPDGSVLIIAEGEQNALEKLKKYVREGPILSRVDNIYVEQKEKTGEFSTFEIIH